MQGRRRLFALQEDVDGRLGLYRDDGDLGRQRKLFAKERLKPRFSRVVLKMRQIQRAFERVFHDIFAGSGKQIALGGVGAGILTSGRRHG